jgi:hypothetical protein
MRNVGYKMPLARRQRKALGLPQIRSRLLLPGGADGGCGEDCRFWWQDSQGGLSVRADMKAKWVDADVGVVEAKEDVRGRRRNRTVRY